MEPSIIGIFGIGLLLALLLLGVPIAFAMAITGISGMLVLLGMDTTLGKMMEYATSYAATYTLSVMPFFVIMGGLALSGGISRDLYDFAYKLGGRLPGGLAIATVLACGAFAACTGSSAACVAAVGKMSLPEMKRHNYDDGLATGVLASAGTLGILIPPSVNAVIYAAITRVSVGKQLIAGILPGILTIIMFSIMIIIRVGLNPKLGPRARNISWKSTLLSAWKVWAVLLTFIALMGSIYAGIATPTEAGAVGALVVFLIALARRQMSWSNFKEAVSETTGVVGMGFAIIMGAGLFGLFMTVSQLPTNLVEYIAGLGLSRGAMLALILIPFFPLGMFIDSISMILLTMPVLFPLVQHLGFDLIWFGILIIKLVEIGLVTPPMAFNVFVTHVIAKDVPVETIYKGITWFVVTDLVTLTILALFPAISLWLPNLMLK